MIKQIIDEIALEGSTKLKMVILGKYKDNELLKKVLYLANSPRIKFYIKQIPEYTPESITPLFELEQALDLLNDFSSRVVTGKAASSRLAYILSAVSANDAIIIERIIGKDLKMNMDGNINKVIEDLIEETPYMGCKSYKIDLAKSLFAKAKKNKVLTGKVYGDVKMDGRYNNGIICDHSVENESRQGEKVIFVNAAFVKELEQFPDMVLNGEFTLAGETNRMVANGIIGSLADIAEKRSKRSVEETAKKIAEFEKEHGRNYEEAAQQVIYTVWDSITLEEYNNKKSDRPYFQRWSELKKIVESLNCERVQLVEKVELNTFEEALEFFQSCLDKGLEGCILKDTNNLWTDGKPTSQIKMKLEMDVDLRVIGFEYGKKGSKFENLITTICCESEDKLLVANPSGLNDALKAYVTENQATLLGGILHTRSCGITNTDKGHSLLHPRAGALKFRTDKKVADTFAEIVDIENMCKGLTVKK